MGHWVICKTRKLAYLFSELELTGQKLDDPLHLFFKADIQDSVSLVDDQALQVLVQEVLRVLKVVQQSTRSCHQNIYS